VNDIDLKVTLEEAIAIVNLLGSLPTSQGGYPLWAKLKAQVEPLIPKPDEVKQ
jgi:hypothetical protein